jgi:hypothetical protein
MYYLTRIKHDFKTARFFLAGIYRLLVKEKGRSPSPAQKKNQGQTQTPQSITVLFYIAFLVSVVEAL